MPGRRLHAMEPSGAGEEELEAAAVRLQSAQRGKHARRATRDRRMDKLLAAPAAASALTEEERLEAAAIRVQCAQRGKNARLTKKQRKEARQAALEAAAAAPALTEAQELEAAAVRLQCAQRGKYARMTKQQRKAAHEAAVAAKEAKAASVLQAANRGHASRREVQRRKERSYLAATKIQAQYKGTKERQDPNAESNVRRERLKLDPQVQAEHYLDRHQLPALFEQLAQALLHAKPDDPKAFLVAKLGALRGADDLSSPMHFFSAEEVDALYDMYDVAKRGMTVAQCAEALKAIGIDGQPLVPAGAKHVTKGEFVDMIMP